MHKPSILGLSENERIALLANIQTNALSSPEKQVVGDMVTFTLSLEEKLKDSEITIANLKRLFGFKGEALKKLLQTL